jgi:hypothetical protein
VVSFTPLPLYSRGKSPRYPLDRRLGAPQSRSEERGEEKILDPTGTENSNPSAPSAVQPLASRYTGSNNNNSIKSKGKATPVTGRGGA